MEFQNKNLVLYKSTIAIVIDVKVKIQLELENGKTIQVRPKDIQLLHPGPITQFSELTAMEGEIQEVFDLVQEQAVTFTELAELLYNDFTPSAALSTYLLLQEGLYFYGSIDAVQVRTVDEFDKEKRKRDRKVKEKEEWHQLITRIKTSSLLSQDELRLQSVIECANGCSSKNKILQELSLESSAENAHKLLLKLGVWDYTINPYIRRFSFQTKPEYPHFSAEIRKEERKDLTHLSAYAIDDEGNSDPDDALSFDGQKIWIHIADVSALVDPVSPIDTFAKEFGANLYLPEKRICMLPPAMTESLGLGLQETSPALSIGVEIDEEGKVHNGEICKSYVRVTRISYQSALEIMNDTPLREIASLISLYRKKREKNNALFLKFPEIKLSVIDGTVSIKKLPRLISMELVEEAMLIAGETAAHFAQTNSIPFPYTTQPQPEIELNPQNLAEMFQCRKFLKPSEIKCSTQLHAGLGLPCYSRVTSPLRRYIDLVAHYQLSAFITKKSCLNTDEVLHKIGSYNAIIGNVKKLERFSNLHWTLVYLLQNPDWQGRAVVVENNERFDTLLVTDLGIDIRIRSTQQLALNEEVVVRAHTIDLPFLHTSFSIV